MKRFLLLCCIALSSANVTFAQAVSPEKAALEAKANVITDKASFSKRIAELDATLAQSDITKAQDIYSGIQVFMQQHLVDSKNALRTVYEGEKPNAYKRYAAEQNSYLKLVDLSKNLPLNRNEVKEQLNIFAKNY